MIVLNVRSGHASVSVDISLSFALSDNTNDRVGESRTVHPYVSGLGETPAVADLPL